MLSSSALRPATRAFSAVNALVPGRSLSLSKRRSAVVVFLVLPTGELLSTSANMPINALVDGLEARNKSVFGCKCSCPRPLAEPVAAEPAEAPKQLLMRIVTRWSLSLPKRRCCLCPVSCTFSRRAEAFIKCEYVLSSDGLSNKREYAHKCSRRRP